MAKPDWELRPDDADYYASRTDYLRQGDIFCDVPLGYPFPPDAADHSEGARKYLAGPFEPGFGMLLSPTCLLKAQGAEGYAHPARLIAPVLPLQRLVDQGAVKPGALADLRTYDHLVAYLYVPEIPAVELPESLALLYMPVTLHHDSLDDNRVAQLSVTGAIHLKRQLARHFTGAAFDHDEFDD